MGKCKIHDAFSGPIVEIFNGTQLIQNLFPTVDNPGFC